jgi:hypothetical protein
MLLIMLGAARACITEIAPKRFWRWLSFINELNRTNPQFTPYQVPEDWQNDRTS